jgi:hypothetical protein
MTYTPAQFMDEPIDGCPRITEEEFQRLKVAGEAAGQARDHYKAIYKEILNRYKDPDVEERYSDGAPKLYWHIEGHNIKKLMAIY